jgi:hypothetical protein
VRVYIYKVEREKFLTFVLIFASQKHKKSDSNTFSHYDKRDAAAACNKKLIGNENKSRNMTYIYTPMTVYAHFAYFL